MGLDQMFGQGYTSPGNQDDPYGLASSYDPMGDSDPTIQAHTADNLQMDPASLYAKIQAQRAALNDQEKALLSRPAASSIPMSREQMLGAALQAALPVIAGYAGGGARGGAMGADYASQTVPELFKGFEGQNQDEANRKDKLDQFTILQKEKELASAEKQLEDQSKSSSDLQGKKDLIDYKESSDEKLNAAKASDKGTKNSLDDKRIGALQDAFKTFDSLDLPHGLQGSLVPDALKGVGAGLEAKIAGAVSGGTESGKYAAMSSAIGSAMARPIEGRASESTVKAWRQFLSPQWNDTDYSIQFRKEVAHRWVNSLSQGGDVDALPTDFYGSSSSSGSSSTGSAGVPDIGGMFNGEKVLSVKRIK